MDRTSLLSSNSLGVSISVLFDGHDVGVRSQELNVSIGEIPSETIDDIPFVRDPGMGAEAAGNGRDTRKRNSAVLESHNVASGNRVPSLPDSDERGRSGESWENEENEWEELLGEHGTFASTSGMGSHRNPPRT